MKLALFGGKPVRKEPFPPYPIITYAEKLAVLDVLDSGILNGFRASKGPGFLGGPKVREFEEQVADYYHVDYAVSFTSATAALHAACDALNVENNEAIVTPYTFNSSVTCVLMANGTPIFADVEYDSCCLDPAEVEKEITNSTRAIILVHLFGGPANMNGLLKAARKGGVKIIEDCAQAPGAKYNGKLVGTFGDCGILSFVADKHVSTGEGGMLITDSEDIARWTRLVRNHGDALHEPMLGWNYRMTEIQAAIGIEQWKKLDEYNEHRIELADYLTRIFSGVPGFTTPRVRTGDKHVYYAYPLKIDSEIIGIKQEDFVTALKAEGIPCGAGYIRPLHLLPLFQKRAHTALLIGENTMTVQKYDHGLCPVAEKLSFRDMVVFPIVRPPATIDDMEDIVRAIHKVLGGRDQWTSG